MYAGLNFTAQSVNASATAAAFSRIMKHDFNATTSEDEISDEVSHVTATAFHGNLNSNYEITLSVNIETNTVEFTAWGDAREMNSDDLASALAPLASCLLMDTITGQFTEQEADADEVDTFAFTVPQNWWETD